MTDGKTVTCQGSERDQYGRLIARCSTEDEPDIGAKLVASGLAWAFVKYSSDSAFTRALPLHSPAKHNIKQPRGASAYDANHKDLGH